MSIVIVHDAIGANVSHLPAGQVAGYTTGLGPVPWTAAQFAAHPGAIRICQDFSATDHTADVLDIEGGAATNADAPVWFKRALANFNSAARPGQRYPCIYTNAANVTAVANSLIAGGVKSGPRLWVAKWDFTSADDIAAITSAGGPFPVVGGQFADGSLYDTSVFSSAWLNATSGQKPPPATSHRKVLKAGETIPKVATARNTSVGHLASLFVQDAKEGDAYYTSNP